MILEAADDSGLRQNSGVARWRQIAESLIKEITSRTYKAGDRLPSDAALAERFGVNRHTVRRAVAHLQQEGYVRVERGRGTFFVGNVLAYKLGTRTRFTENLRSNKRAASRLVVAVQRVRASEAVAAALKLRKGQECILLQALGEADNAPLSLGRNYFPLPRCEALFDIAERARQDGSGISITDLLRRCGISQYSRKQTKVSARLPSAEDAHILRMAPSQPLLCTESIDVDAKGVPVIYATTAFRADRLQFLVEE